MTPYSGDAEQGLGVAVFQHLPFDHVTDTSADWVWNCDVDPSEIRTLSLLQIVLHDSCPPCPIVVI